MSSEKHGIQKIKLDAGSESGMTSARDFHWINRGGKSWLNRF